MTTVYAPNNSLATNLLLEFDKATWWALQASKCDKMSEIAVTRMNRNIFSSALLLLGVYASIMRHEDVGHLDLSLLLFC